MLILVAGLSGSGKTTYAQLLAEKNPSVIVGLDNFYFGKAEKPRSSSVGVWGNDPGYCDAESLVRVASELKAGRAVLSPQFSFITQDRVEPRLIKPQEQVIVEGLWMLNFPELRDLADKKIYIETPYEVRLERRLIRDVERGRARKESEAIAHEVDSLGEIHVELFKKFADVIVDGSHLLERGLE